MIVVHIGMPKAGSTTIQRFLGHNDEPLRGLSIDYPDVGRENPNHRLNHRNFANELLGRESRINKKSGSLADLASHLAAVRHGATILSSEELCRCRPDSVERFHTFLSQFIGEIRIVLIVRDLVDLMPSAYAQSIRFGANTGDFDAFFEQRANNEILDQFNVAERWANVFGWDAMRVRPLNPAALRDGDLIADFLASAGVDPDAPALRALPRPPRANESAGWKTLEAVRAFFAGQSHLEEDHPLMRMKPPTSPRSRKNFGYAAESVGYEIGWNQDRGLYLTLEQASSCLETHNSGIRELNKHLQEKLPCERSLEDRAFVEREFLPDARHIDSAELKAFYDAWAARLEERREARRRERRGARA